MRTERAEAPVAQPPSTTAGNGVPAVAQPPSTTAGNGVPPAAQPPSATEGNGVPPVAPPPSTNVCDGVPPVAPPPSTMAGNGVPAAAQPPSATEGNGVPPVAPPPSTTAGSGVPPVAPPPSTTTGSGVRPVAQPPSAAEGGEVAPPPSTTMGGGVTSVAPPPSTTVGGGVTSVALPFSTTVGGGVTSVALPPSATEGGEVPPEAPPPSTTTGSGEPPVAQPPRTPAGSGVPQPASTTAGSGVPAVAQPPSATEGSQSPAGSKSPAEGKLNITLASDVNNWENAVNTQLVVELAKDSRLKVSGFVPCHTEEQRNNARILNIELVDAEDLSGYSPAELLDHPPDSLKINILLIHSYGPGLGRQAQVIKKLKKCKWAQVMHTISNELYKFLENPHDCKDDHQLQVTLCEKADIIIAIGPKVAEAYRRYLRHTSKHENVIELTPGVIEQLTGVRQVYDVADKFHVLVSGSSYYFKVKGCDIAAKAIKLLNTSSYHLMVVLRPFESTTGVEEITQALLKEGIDCRQLTVRVCKSNADWRQLLCEADLVIKPSRTEGFGMSGLLAISANVPVLVSAFSGLGVILKKLHIGASHVVDSDDPQVWADKITEIRSKDPQSRHLQALNQRQRWKKQQRPYLMRALIPVSL